MCDEHHVFTNSWHRNVRYLSMKCSLHIIKVWNFDPLVGFQLVHSLRLARRNRSSQLKLYVNVPYNVFVSWPLGHLLTFLHEGHVHKSIFIFQVRVNKFANIPFVFVNSNYVVSNVTCFGIISYDFCRVFSNGVICMVISIVHELHCPPWIYTSQ
jgi:hypothetical protein